MTPPASGAQHEIAFRDQRAIVTEIGGGLRTYTVGDHDVIDGYDEDTMCPSGRGQVLAPWPNRLEDGRYQFDDTDHQVPLDEPESHNAIHGLVRWRPWTVRTHEAHRVVVEHRLHPQPGYPFTLELTIEYTLSDAGLTVTTTAANLGPDSCPYGIGAHPYLTLGQRVDALTLRVHAQTVLESDERGLPNGSQAVDGSDYDFRRPRAIGTTILDHCFTDLDRDADGLARVALTDTEHDASVNLWIDGSYPYLMLFTGDPLPDVARRALAVEPMTCPPNAFHTTTGVIRLPPRATHTSMWGITASLE